MTDDVTEVPVPGSGKSIHLNRTKMALGDLRKIITPDPVSVHWLNDVFGPRIDPAGHVFLGRAIRELGKAFHGGDWSGKEPAVNFSLQPLPDRSFSDLTSQTVSPAEKYAALEILGKTAPPRRPGWDLLMPDQWNKAQSLRLEALGYISDARSRALAVFEMLEGALAKGAMHSSLQAISGGALSLPRPASEWLAPWPTILGRMIKCGMNDATPFSVSLATHWIFVDRDGLSKLVAAKRKSREGEPEATALKLTLAYLEPYKAHVRNAVIARPEGPPERDKLIKEGREIYRLPKETAETAYREAVSTAGVPHVWSKPGPRSNSD